MSQRRRHVYRSATEPEADAKPGESCSVPRILATPTRKRMSLKSFEPLLLKSSRGLISRFRILSYRLLGLKAGRRNRMETMRCRRLAHIQIGKYNAFTEGCWLWPDDSEHEGIRIRIGDY